jgi:N-acetylglucosaminyl-diphospho-decaprenol L-rhamnosyltransferase
MYAEDIEWGCRMRGHGYKVFYLPFLHFIHLQGGSDRLQSAEDRFSVAWIENLRAIYKRYNPGASLAVFNGLLGAGYCLRAVLYQGRYVLSRDPRFLHRARQMRYYARYLLLHKQHAAMDVLT